MDDLTPPPRRITAEQPPIVVTGIEWQRVAIGVLSLLTVIGMSLAGWVGSQLGDMRRLIDETKTIGTQATVQNAERHGEMRARVESLERDIRRIEGQLRGKR